MSDVLIAYDTVITAPDGSRWTPHACGRVADDGLWEGWIEFVSADSSRPSVRSPRETEQPNRADLTYWATGLTEVYLQGALTRALRPARPLPVDREVQMRPHFEAPAERQRTTQPITPRPVLNPFEVYRQGQGILDQELSALDVNRLRDIAVGYGFASAGSIDNVGRGELTSLITRQVRSAMIPQSGSTASEASRDSRANP